MECQRGGGAERIDEGVLWLFSLVKRMEKAWIARRVYVEECAGSCSVGRLCRGGLIP